MVKKGEFLIEINGLRKLYNEGACAKGVLDHIASRKYNSVETTVDRFERVLRRENVDCSRRELISVLKELENLRCGTFVTGRRGQPSRFQWKVQMIDVGRAARGEVGIVPQLRAEEAKPEESEEADLASDAIRHNFNLRPDYTVTFDLPSNFSAKEAARLAEFIKTLPFNQD